MNRKILLIAFILIMAIGSINVGAVTIYAKKTVTQDNFIVFSDINYNDIKFSKEQLIKQFQERDKIKAVVFTTLPDFQVGQLKYKNTEVLPYQKIKINDIKHLSFAFMENEVSEASNSILIIYKSGKTRNVVVRYKKLPKDHKVPTINDIELYSSKDISVFLNIGNLDGCKLVFSDNNGVLLENLSDRVKLTPVKKISGKEDVRYYMIDSYGQKSNTAKIRINIKKPKTDVFYADMNDNPAHFASLVLAERNVMSGKKIGNISLFEPTFEVTRGEFSAMAELALGKKSVDGTTLDQNDKITRGEAMTIIYNFLNITDEGSAKRSFYDIDEISPSERQAIAVLAQNRLINGYPDNTIRAWQNLTRQEAAVMLYNAIAFSETNKNNSKNFLYGIFMGK